MNKVILHTMAIAVLAGSISGAFAEDKASKKPRRTAMMERVDTNKDGVITKEESLAFNEMWFSQRDTDKDGKITKEEMKAFRAKQKEERKKAKAETDAEAAAPSPAR